MEISLTLYSHPFERALIPAPDHRRPNRGGVDLVYNSVLDQDVERAVTMLPENVLRSYMFSVSGDYEGTYLRKLIGEGNDCRLSYDDVVEAENRQSSGVLSLSRKPDGELAYCGDTYVCAGKLQKFLKQYSDIEFLTVYLKGNAAKNLFGVSFRDRRRYLSDASWAPDFYASENPCPSGILVSDRKLSENSIILDSTPDVLSPPPIVVSNDVAAKILTNLPDVGLRPVFHTNSRIGQRIESLANRLKERIGIVAK